MTTDEAEQVEASWDRVAHQRALLLQRRCGHCAERLRAKVLLRGLDCPRCGRPARWPGALDAESLADAVDTRWRRRRWLVYGLVTLSTGATGFLPVVPTVITVIVMIVVRHSFLREPMRWFSPGRKLVTGLNLKLWLVLVSSLTLAANAMLSLLPFVNIVLNALVCLGTTALFVEVALVYLRGRLRREASEGPGLELWEWGVPALLAGLVLVAMLTALGALVMTVEFLDGLVT